MTDEKIRFNQDIESKILEKYKPMYKDVFNRITERVRYNTANRGCPDKNKLSILL